MRIWQKSFNGGIILKMTLHTLEYLLSFSLPLCPINEEHEKHRLKGFKLWDEQARFWDVLYLISPEGLRILRQSIQSRRRFCQKPVVSHARSLCLTAVFSVRRSLWTAWIFSIAFRIAFFLMRCGWRKSEKHCFRPAILRGFFLFAGLFCILILDYLMTITMFLLPAPYRGWRDCLWSK